LCVTAAQIETGLRLLGEVLAPAPANSEKSPAGAPPAGRDARMSRTSGWSTGIELTEAIFRPIIEDVARFRCRFAAEILNGFPTPGRPQCLHADRAPRCHRHHCDPYWLAAASRAEGA